MRQLYRHADGITSEPSGERVVVLDAAGETVTTLNPTGAIAWPILATASDLDAVVDGMRTAFPDVETATLRADALAFVRELLDAGLIVAVDAQG